MKEISENISFKRKANMIHKNYFRSISVALAGALLLATTACQTADSSTDASAQSTSGAAIEEAAPAASTEAPEQDSTTETSAAEMTEAAAEEAATLTGTVTRDEKYDSAILSLTPDDFEKAGITFGDSCDITFESGYSLTDVPYYNGYYVQTGDAVINGDVEKQRIKIARNSQNFWTPAGLEENEAVTITLNTAGKYLATYEALGKKYSVDRSDYASDEIYANFRELSGGNLKKGLLYRGSSPTNNKYNRAEYAAKLVEDTGIACILDLSDSEDDLKELVSADDYSSDYVRKLYEDGDIIALGLTMDYESEEYRSALAEGLLQLENYDGPFYIHCQEGINRTGFVCILLESLAGADYDALEQDYMESCSNYYNVTAADTPEQYQAVKALYLDPILEYLTGEEEVSADADFEKAAEDYLAAGGMTADEIQQLKTRISNS